jgi:hypothetical protein
LTVSWIPPESTTRNKTRFRRFVIGGFELPMPHANYYLEQARLLLSMAQVTRDAERAALLEAQARLFQNLARVPESPTSDLTSVLHEFNRYQMRKGLGRRRPAR